VLCFCFSGSAILVVLLRPWLVADRRARRGERGVLLDGKAVGGTRRRRRRRRWAVAETRILIPLPLCFSPFYLPYTSS
jgi:hypothetical protein